MTGRGLKEMLRTVHLWTGLILCVPMILIGLSGSILLFERELLRGSPPAASTEGQYQPIAQIFAAAEKARPPDMIARWIELPRGRGKPAIVQFAVDRRQNPIFQAYVDPVSLEVLGSAPIIRRGPIATWFMRLHEFMLMPSGFGLRFVGWIAIAMTFMAASGLILWWPKPGRWKRAFLVRRGVRGLPLHLDLHHAVGIWGFLFFFILSVSGIYLAFPQAVSSGLRIFVPHEFTGVITEAPSPGWPADAEQAIRLAETVVPNARVRAMQPLDVQRPVVLQMDPSGLAPAVPPITVAFDPSDPRAISIDDPRHYSTADRILNFAYALHFSLGMGPLWSIIVFVSGLLPLVLAVTGITIWLKKRQSRRAMQVAIAE